MIAGLGYKFAVCLFALVLAGASTAGAQDPCEEADGASH